jgi:predicted DNA-binding transcriptional regulator AlpA
MSELIQFGESQLLSVRETAHCLGVSRRTLERIVSRGQFPPPLKIGAKSLYTAADIESHIAKLVAARLVNR